MKSEELFIILASWFLGILGTVSDLLFYKLYQHLAIPDLNPIYPSIISIWSLVFYGFTLYFLFKYTGIIKFLEKRRKKKWIK